MTTKPYLLLKWGTVKGWSNLDKSAPYFPLFEKYMEDASISCMTDNPTQERKELLCQFINLFDGQIQNDWTGEIYKNKQDAIKYIMEYDACPLTIS